MEPKVITTLVATAELPASSVKAVQNYLWAMSAKNRDFVTQESLERKFGWNPGLLQYAIDEAEQQFGMKVRA